MTLQKIDTFFSNCSHKRTIEESISTDQHHTSETKSLEKIHAIIYKWKFKPPFNHVLAGCCYFGQTLQKFNVRMNRHKNDSKINPKELGLHSLWKQYPYDSYWEISLIEEKYFDDKVSAGYWMNEREITLIEEHGGKLRDMDKKLRQTLNLTSGGQGDPRKVYEAIHAVSRRKLKKRWIAYKQYVEREKHPNVSYKHVETIQVGNKEEKVKLGQIVHAIRSRRNFLQHEDFREWLDLHGFSYDMHRTYLDTYVWPAFKQYVERVKHPNVPRNHVETIQVGDKEEKVNLGQIVLHIRSRGNFLQHEDFKMWMWCACFKLHAKDGEENSRRWKQAFDT